jgi:hypothetical protein
MTHPLTSLPFVQADDAGQVASMWNVAPTGDWSADNVAGAAHADDLIGLMSRTENPTILSHVVKAIGGREWTGLEVGFFHRLATVAI